jgi:hypothetical protein
MSTDPRRLAVVVARYDAGPGTPPGIEDAAFARSCLADTYEVLADLQGVTAGISGPSELAELLWPGDRLYPDLAIRDLARLVSVDFDELVVVPADVPDLPGLVIAKMFKVLHRMDLVVGPERGGTGCAALGVRLPPASWLPDLDLDEDATALSTHAGSGRHARSPDWHRLRTPGSVDRLDPGLEGWDETRALLSGRRLGAP